MKTLLIGRHSRCDIFINDNQKSISRKHAKLNIYPDGRCSIEDLNSTNKTFINSNALVPNSPYFLKKGEKVVLAGKIELNWELYQKKYLTISRIERRTILKNDFNRNPEIQSKSRVEDDYTKDSTLEKFKSPSNQFQRNIEELKQDLKIRGKEIDILQIELNKPKKWWKNISNVVSIAAVIISVIATLYTILNDSRKEENEIKQKVKQIVKRITEIQALYINSENNIGTIQQTTMAELSNLIDEFVEIAKADPKLINDSEYSTIVSMAFNTNKTEDVKMLINNGLSIANDATTKYALLNSKARYYFDVEKKPHIGRESILKVIEITKNQSINENMKTANIALEYFYWSSFEFGIENYKKADSLLSIAEDMVINRADAWKFENFPVVTQIKEGRKFMRGVIE